MSLYDNGLGAAFSFVKKERRGRRSELPDDVAKKLKSCSVLGCEEWRDLTAHTTYHCFPTGEKNQQRWEIWTSLLQKARDDSTWIPFRGSLVCSHHFRASDFVQDPNQKRTKLVKNAIPSTFPTFQVDLDDPTFILDDTPEFDSIEGDDNKGYGLLEELAGEYSGQNSYDYENQEQEYENQEDEEEPEMPIPEVQYDDEEPEDEPEIQYYVQPSVNRSRPPNLTPANNLVRRSHEIFSMGDEGEPPRKRTANSNEPKKPQLTFQGSVAYNETNGSGRSSIPSNSNQKLRSKLYEQLCKSNGSSDGPSKLPFSWNPDLEIEVLEAASDDGNLRLRIEELESEKEVIKNKYETQIRALQRKIRDQDRIINEYAVRMNSLKRQKN